MSEQNEKLHKVFVDRSRCCGYGLCAALCPDVYKLDGDGIVFLESEFVPAGQEEAASEGAAACPAEAIRVEAPAP
jgi:ferredoxin